MDTWQSLIGLLEFSKFTNLEFSIKLMISHELQPFRMKTVIFARSCGIQWNNNNIRELFGPFCMTMQNFCIFMWNQLTHLPWLAVDFPPLVHFVQSCEIFVWLYESATYWFLSSSWSFFQFSYFDYKLATSNKPKSQSKPIALLLLLCIWIIINIICSPQFDSSLLSSIYQNHTLKWLHNFIKLVSNFCKGNNMLIECFRHNYYSKYVKLMRIII